MTTSRNIYSPRQATARGERLALRFTSQELQDIEDLADRYSRAKGLKRTATKTIVIRQALQALAKAYPKETALVIKFPRLFAPPRHAAA
jgi:hypothetical protein